MKFAFMGALALLTLTACDTKTDATPKSQSIALHVCPSGGGELLLAGDSPEASGVHRNNAGCVLDYLAGFEKDPLNGSKPTQEQVAMCSSVTRAALVIKSDLEAGKSLQDELATVAENGNPMVARSLAKIIKYVYSHPQQSGEDARATLEEQCQKHPRSFYLISGDEVRRYRVLNGPSSPQEIADAEVQKLLTRSPRLDSAKSLDEHVRDCVAEATRDKSVLGGVTSDEIEAACYTGLRK